ncbi:MULTISPECIES: lipid-binding SYLF domain-containing protein [Flavobacteriaceae]|uniref:lipid-binding SYLF domain-containing protein n=1 Tax=Flavobacteriaceae TaxID=49546 RepID=UPI001492B307|nr:MULTISPECIES: lipid-binding SYLF domain-containing protein [Allomuricauda]MDC6365347.1 lipid-binding SYLF domain-containing protein [Muricauda sp. AC10]
MNKMKSFALLLLLLVGTVTMAQSKKDRKIMNDAKKAKKTLLQADSGLERFFEESAGYVLFPNVGKGGFIIGGASGNGVVYEKGEAIGMANLKKLNVGLQAGGQAIIEIIFFETPVDLERFKEGKFQFSAETSAVALKSGIAFNAKYKEGIAVFALPKAGLMADASVGGQKFGYKPF